MPDLPALPLTSGPPTSRALPPADPDQALRTAAQALEANFLSVMLQNAGLGAAREAFGGGAGEEHFASFLAEAQATALAERGGIGLAESLFRSMRGQIDAG